VTESSRIPDSLLADIRARLPIDGVISRTIPLRKTGAWRMARCPLCGGSKLSFGCKQGDATFHCFRCGEHGDVFAWTMKAEGCDFREAVRRCAAEAGVPFEATDAQRRVVLAPPPPAPPRDNTQRQARAQSLWRGSVPIDAGSPVARYLESRGLWPLPDSALAVLRSARLTYPRDGEDGAWTYPAGRGRHPVMIARVDAPGQRCSAVHCTFLTAEGSKLPLDPDHQAKIVFGPLPEGAAVRLFPHAEAMGVAEGIETALAAARLFAPLPVWSALSAGGLSRFVPPRDTRAVTIFADNDKPYSHGSRKRPEGEGIYVGRALQARLRDGGREAGLRVPLAPFGDYADVLAGGMLGQ
jgi:hypothetical protein